MVSRKVPLQEEISVPLPSLVRVTMGGGKLMDRQQMVTFSPSITRWEGNTSTVVFLGGAAGEHYNRGIDYSIDY